jgi:hypothetical protein
MAMTKMVKLIATCERCGAQEATDAPVADRIVSWDRLTCDGAHSAAMADLRLNRVLDICPKCAESFIEWWAGGRPI